MKPVVKCYFYEDSLKFFGEGPYRLLKGIERLSSLRAAALEEGMAYSKAFSLIKNAEQALGFALTQKRVGGKNGGGSVLTERAVRFLSDYELFLKKVNAACLTAFDEVFSRPKIGCAVMASGQSERFSGNKLITPFLGKPLASCAVALAASTPFDKRILLTRSEEVKTLFEGEIPVLLHDKPHKSETIALAIKELSDMDGILFLQADQPLVKRKSIEKMLSSFEQNPQACLRLSFGKTVASPVLFPKRLFEALAHLSENESGNALFSRGETFVPVFAEGEEELADIDTQEDLLRLERSAISAT